MNYTENYQLPQWVESDRVLMEDFNEANSTIDQALGEHAAILAGCGNCQIETFTYTGTGTFGVANPTRIQFSGKPVMFAVLDGSFLLFGSYGDTSAPMVYRTERSYDISPTYITTTWDGTEVSFCNTAYAAYQGNKSGQVYRVVALYAMDERE